MEKWKGITDGREVDTGKLMMDGVNEARMKYAVYQLCLSLFSNFYIDECI